MSCELCGGPLMLLGVLGNLEHCSCRNCGMMFTSKVEGNPNCTCGDRGTCDECRYQRAAANCSEEDSYNL